MVAKLDGTNGLLQQYDYQTPSTGFSYTFAAGVNVLVMQPAGTLATGAITMPAVPVDGMTITFSSTQAITALTVSANTGQSIVGNPTTMLAGGAMVFLYRAANTTWYAQISTVDAATGGVVLNAYTTPGTWTKPATLKSIKVTVVGGGGSTPPIAATTNAKGSGGGGGGAAIFIYPAPSLPGPQPYTVGTAGSTSSFGVAPITVISATGGSDGSTNTSGGAGGVGSSGTLNIAGGGGGGSTSASTSGAGGSSIYGGGARGNAVPNSVGIAGGAYGGGASGASVGNPAVAQAGASGATGVVIIEEFY